MQKDNIRHHIHLHFLVFIAGFTAILGKLITNSPVSSEIKEDKISEDNSTVAQINEEVSENNNQSDSEITDDMISPLIEKKETIVATGYAVVSVQNHDTASQQRLLAIRASKLEAYRSLVEQVYGQYLDASTTIADMVVMSDTFRSKVEGVIYGARVVSINPVGDDTYETTLSLDMNVVKDLRKLYLQYLARRNS